MKKKFFKFFALYTIVSLLTINFAFVEVKTTKADGPIETVQTVYVKSTWTVDTNFATSEVNYPNLVWDETAFNDINTAISTVYEGSTIYLLDNGLGDSVYDFNLLAKVVINKAVRIIGEELLENKKVTIGSNITTATSSYIFFEIDHSDVSINNLQITKAMSGISIKNNFEKITIENNIITNCSNGIELRSGSLINVLNNKIENNITGVGLSSLSNYSNEINILGNEINNNSIGMQIYSLGHNVVNINNNKIYLNGLTNFDSTKNFYYIYMPGFDTLLSVDEILIWNEMDILIGDYSPSINFDKNWWGSNNGPSFYSFLVSSDFSSANLSMNSNSMNTNNVVIFGFVEIPVDLGLYCSSFRPFCTNSECTEFSNRIVSINPEDGLSELFNPYFGTMSIPLHTDEGDGSAITTSTQINVNEDVVIEIPTIANLSSTTISLSSTTVITKTDGGSFEFGNLSAQDMNKEGLSGFQEILSNFQSGDLIGALQWGIPSVGLTFSSAVIIDMYVGTEFSNQTLNLYRSISTSSGWTTDGLEGVDGAATGTCKVSVTGMCKFGTKKASYFGALTISSSGGGDDDGSSSGSSAPISLPAGIGGGFRDITSSNIGAILNAGEIGNTGVNFLTYVTNQNNFSAGESSHNWKGANHYFIIDNLNLDTEIARLTFHSDSKTIDIKKGETKDLDLDSDNINDIRVIFSNIYVNRAEITVKSLSNISTETPETITTETIKITNDSLYNRLKGKILLKVEDNGRAYYVSPTKKEMYYLGRPSDAFSIMRQQGIGVTDTDLNKILTFGNKIDKNINTSFSKKHNGKIFLQVQQKGEAWYVDTANNSKHYLGRPNDAFSIMRNLGLGISNLNFSAMSK